MKEIKSAFLGNYNATTNEVAIEVEYVDGTKEILWGEDAIQEVTKQLDIQRICGQKT